MQGIKQEKQGADAGWKAKAVSPCTGPCGMQSVVQKTRGVNAKVDTFLCTVTDFYPMLIGEC